MKRLKIIKLIKDLSHVYGGKNLKKNEIYTSINCPDEFKDKYKHHIWIMGNENGKDIPIRVLPLEYELVEEKIVK